MWPAKGWASTPHQPPMANDKRFCNIATVDSEKNNSFWQMAKCSGTETVLHAINRES